MRESVKTLPANIIGESQIFLASSVRTSNSKCRILVGKPMRATFLFDSHKSNLLNVDSLDSCSVEIIIKIQVNP